MCRLGLSVRDRALKEGLGEAVGAAEGVGGGCCGVRGSNRGYMGQTP